MSTAAGDRAAAIFFALSRVPRSDRARMLDQQCAGDPGLRSEVERLLARLTDTEDDLATSVGPVSPSAPGDGTSLPAGSAIGDFIVIRQIGAGGTGVVHLAHQQHPPRVVALKVLRREFLASAVQRRFEIEAELLAHLHHPGIAQVFAAHTGDATTPPFIAMELVSGPPLTEYADSHELPLRARVELLARVADAVQHAHQRGIIHRDLKPGNILVGEDGQPKVLDFGVARRIEQVSPVTIATETGQLVGTLAYMSPEQVQAVPEAIDTRTDIHALGVILFRLLAGRLPFGHDNPPLPELARRIAQDEAPKLGTIVPSVRGDLEIIVSRTLAKEKERRYPSAAAFAADLRRYLDGRPITASADSAWYLVRRQVRRYRLAFAFSAAMLLIVSALAAYAITQRRHADDLNIRLREQLAASTIERARLLGMTGNHPAAEELAWRELFRNPDARHARWTLWEMYSRDATLWTQVLHDKGTFAVRFSPDGRYLLTTGRVDGLLRLVEVHSGHVVRTFTTEPPSGARHSFFTNDGRAIVSGSEDGTLRMWDVATGELRREVPRAMPVLFDLSISPDGGTAITVALRRVEQWSLTEGRRVADLSSHVHPAPASAAELSPVAPLVVIGSDHGHVLAVDLDTGRKLWHVRGHTGLVTGITFTADGRTVASGSFDGYVRLWDARSGKPVQAINTASGRVRNIAFDRTGTRLAVGAQWRSQVWDLTRPDQPLRDLGGSEGTTDIDLTLDGRVLATCHGATGQVRVWDLDADPRVDRWKQPGSVRSMAIGPDGDSIVTASLSNLITWRAGVSTPIASFGADGTVARFDLSRNRRWAAVVGVPGIAAIWNLADGRRLAQLPGVGAARAVSFGDDDRLVFTGEPGGVLRTWQWRDGVATPIRQTASPAAGEILAIASHGPRVFVAYTDHVVAATDINTGQELGRIQTTAAPFSVAVSPNGRWMAAGTYLGAVYIWEIATGRLIDPVKGQIAIVNGLDFSQDSSLLAIASRDGSTRIWDVERQLTLAVIATRSVPAEQVRFLADGQRLAIGYSTGDLEVVDLNHFLRHIAGNAEYQLSLLRAAGEALPRAAEVIDWSRKILGDRTPSR